ncbi:MAG: hypothetical protein H6732_07575 [Alphaproteobacteria bacterium]|nr:hypothetical protein [Alphaproteobacteria bacterium]
MVALALAAGCLAPGDGPSEDDTDTSSCPVDPVTSVIRTDVPFDDGTHTLLSLLSMEVVEGTALAAGTAALLTPDDPRRAGLAVPPSLAEAPLIAAAIPWCGAGDPRAPWPLPVQRTADGVVQLDVSVRAEDVDCSLDCHMARTVHLVAEAPEGSAEWPATFPAHASGRVDCLPPPARCGTPAVRTVLRDGTCAPTTGEPVVVDAPELTVVVLGGVEVANEAVLLPTSEAAAAWLATFNVDRAVDVDGTSGSWVGLFGSVGSSCDLAPGVVSLSLDGGRLHAELDLENPFAACEEVCFTPYGELTLWHLPDVEATEVSSCVQVTTTCFQDG